MEAAAFASSKASRKSAPEARAAVLRAFAPMRLVERPAWGAAHGRRELVLQVEYVLQPSVTDLTFGVLLHRSTDGLTVYDANFLAAELDIDWLSLGFGKTNPRGEKRKLFHDLRRR